MVVRFSIWINFAKITAFLAFVICLLDVSTAFAKIDNCASAYKSYRQEAIHRAFATTARRNPRSSLAMSCGWSNGYDTKALAIAEALRTCRIEDRKRRDFGSCQIYDAE